MKRELEEAEDGGFAKCSYWIRETLTRTNYSHVRIFAKRKRRSFYEVYNRRGVTNTASIRQNGTTRSLARTDVRGPSVK